VQVPWCWHAYQHGLYRNPDCHYRNCIEFQHILQVSLAAKPQVTRLHDGYSRRSEPGSFLTPEDRVDEMNSVLAMVGEGQAVEPFETIRVRRDGTLVPVSLAVSPICDPDGAVGASALSRMGVPTGATAAGRAPDSRLVKDPVQLSCAC
jgi:hypothetical protein